MVIQLPFLRVWFDKYRGGTSDATTSSSPIVPLFMMSVDDYSPSKQPYSLFENNWEWTNGPMDGHDLL